MDKYLELIKSTIKTLIAHIASDPSGFIMFVWENIFKSFALILLGIIVLNWILSMTKVIKKKKLQRITSLCICLSFIALCCWTLYRYDCPSSPADTAHEDYRSYFNDVQKVQIIAARKYGIKPIKNRTAAQQAIQTGNLVKLSTCRNYKLAPMSHSIPYLTNNAAQLLSDIGGNFRDSLNSKGMCAHKIVVTSVLRTDEDVERLMKQNSVAVKNSAHRHATTFDISYRDYERVGLGRTDKSELKKVLSQVLIDLKERRRCYVKYEVKSGCYHITVRS